MTVEEKANEYARSKTKNETYHKYLVDAFTAGNNFKEVKPKLNGVSASLDYASSLGKQISDTEKQNTWGDR